MILLLCVGALILIQGCFALSEMALLSADQARLRELAEREVSGAAAALQLLARPERILSVTLFMTGTAVILSSSLVTMVALEAFPRTGQWLAVVLTSPLIVIFGELIPKAFGKRYATRVACRMAIVLRLAYWVGWPFTKMLSSFMQGMTRFLAPLERLMGHRIRSSREQLQDALDLPEATVAQNQGYRMIRRVLHFFARKASDAMIPLVDIKAIDESLTVRQALELFEVHRHSRMPVFRARVDQLIGVIEMKDLVSVSHLALPLKHMCTSPLYVPESQSLESILKEMRQGSQEMAIVVDEYGGAVGILTQEDIMEEIVGEINDEYDEAESLFRTLGSDLWSVAAKTELKTLAEELQLELPQGSYQTLAGYLLHLAGRIPQQGEVLLSQGEEEALEFTITKATERQLEQVLVRKLPAKVTDKGSRWQKQS
jgi:putative hemolysin